jgi:hypothetical protein
MQSRLAAIALAIALPAMLSFVPATALAAPWFGLDDHSVTGGQAGASQSAGLAAQEGASSSRVTLNWAWVQPTNTTPSFGTYDAIYNADLARGIHPLFVLTGSPTWAQAPGEPCSPGYYCPPASNHDADWQHIAAQIATRYPQLAGIEIWNEPNMTWAWGSTPDPARYTQLLRQAYTAIKAANPNLPVIGGALATDLATTITSDAYPAPMYLKAMYANGAHGYMNGLSMHPYPQAMDWWYTYKALSTLTEIRNNAGDNSALWITETGMSTTQGTWTANDQSVALANLVPALLAYPGVAGVYVHTLVEPANLAATDPERGYGLLYANLTPKPAYCALAGASSTGYACPAGISVPQPTAAQTAHWSAENLLQAAAGEALAWHNVHGTYSGLTSSALHTADPRLSATPAPAVNPGSTADPSQIGIWFMAPDGVLLCNTSQADLSYCIYTQSPGTWIYGQAAGTVYVAAYAVLHQVSNTWSGSTAGATSTTAVASGGTATAAATTDTGSTSTGSTTPATAPVVSGTTTPTAAPVVTGTTTPTTAPLDTGTPPAPQVAATPTTSAGATGILPAGPVAVTTRRAGSTTRTVKHSNRAAKRHRRAAHRAAVKRKRSPRRRRA